jgi:transposase InsO family protein
VSAVAALERRVAELEAEAEICRRLAGFCDGGPDRDRRYRFIESETDNFTVAALCRATRVARSSYYEWRKRSEGPSEALLAEAVLANRIYGVWKRSKGRYGSPRVTAALHKAGVDVNEKRVARLMGELGIAGRCGRRKVRTTWRDKRQAAAVDLVLRHFTAATIDETWVGDVTYVPTGQGWLFVASVLDVHSRLLVGWSIADHLRTELCSDALEAAVAARGRVRMAGTILHTDHGCQYTSGEFKDLCRRLGVRQSMGTVGDSYDNAMAESLWASLKRELVDGTYFATKAEARLAIFEWINWYNTERLHSSLGYQSPQEFEQAWQDQEAA